MRSAFRGVHEESRNSTNDVGAYYTAADATCLMWFHNLQGQQIDGWGGATSCSQRPKANKEDA